MTSEDQTQDGMAWRGFVEHAWRSRRRLAALSGGILLAASLLGLVLPPRYVSHSTLVLLLGPEYTVRAPAGSGPAPNTAFDADHILGTETEILSSDDLHRDVIRSIGLARLYPKLLQPPSLPMRMLAAIKGAPDMLARLAGSEPAHHADDPLEEAVAIFAAKLDIKPSKLASVITLGFSHRDASVARDVLRTLERLYLQRRRVLYSRQDSRAMRADVERARRALDVAEAALASFRLSHGLPDYGTQLASLLREQGDVEQDAIAARRAEAAGQARIAELEMQRSRLPAMVAGGSDTSLDAHTAALRNGIEELRAREAATLSRYRQDSPAARDIETQIQARNGELASSRPATLSASHTVRNGAFDAVVSSLLQLQAEQRGLDAQLADDDAEDVAITRRIATLGQDERALDALITRRSVLLDDLRGLASAESSQQDVEAVEAASLPSVRVAAAPSLPIRPRPLRLLLMMAGFAFGMIGCMAAALAGHAWRRTILLGDELETLGIAMLARVPHGDAMMGQPPIMPLAA